MASFLQLLKETGMRPGEAWQLKWMDIDFEKNIVNVTPEKGSRPRIFKISGKLAAMLRALQQRVTVFSGMETLNISRRTSGSNVGEQQPNLRIQT